MRSARFLLGLAAAIAAASCGGTVVGPGGGGAGSTSSGGGASATSTNATSTGSLSCGDCCGFSCCNGQCVNEQNDINNCGVCGKVCPQGYCDHGTCAAVPCMGGPVCDPPGFCCGATCCNEGLLCCDVPGPIEQGPTCVTPTADGTCPKGCLDCKCDSPGTPVATPSGEKPIEELREGDLVYSVHGASIVAVPIERVNRVAAPAHRVMHVELASGRALEISAKHPTADGRRFGDLRPGDRLDGELVLEAREVPLAGGFTFDILPASDSGTYFAAGVRIGSTMR